MIGSVRTGLLLLGDRQIWLRRGIEFALAILAGFMAFGLISQIRQNHPAPPSYMRSAAPSASQDAARWTGNIAQHHLFGEPAGSAKTAQTAGDSLSLTGIIYSTNPDDSRAILQAGGTTLVVASGMQLPDGGKVTRIGSDRIAIERNGVTEEIVLQIDTVDLSADSSFAAVDQGGNLNQDTSDQTLADSPHGAAASSAPMTQVYHADAVPLSAIRGKQAAERFKMMLPPVLPAKKAKKPKT